jgi:hypothetical protein
LSARSIHAPDATLPEMKTTVLIVAAVAEAATGVALVVAPSLVGRLLLGEPLAGLAVPMARVAGVALLALGVACFPGGQLLGMLIYSAIVGLYLAYLGSVNDLAGVLLWPAVVLHLVLTALLSWAFCLNSLDRRRSVS